MVFVSIAGALQCSTKMAILPSVDKVLWDNKSRDAKVKFNY
jgi:hypothetical protein